MHAYAFYLDLNSFPCRPRHNEIQVSVFFDIYFYCPDHSKENINLFNFLSSSDRNKNIISFFHISEFSV